MAPITSATTRPMGVFIRVTPHMLENSVADPNCMLTCPTPRGCRARCFSSRERNFAFAASRLDANVIGLLGRLSTRSVAAHGRPPGSGAPRCPATHRTGPCLSRRARVTGQQPEQVTGVGEVAVVVVLTGADDGRGDVVAVAGGDLHDELTAEQRADELLEDDVGGEQQFAPVPHRGELFDHLAGRLPLRRVLPHRPGGRYRRTRRAPRTGRG